MKIVVTHILKRKEISILKEIDPYLISEGQQNLFQLQLTPLLNYRLGNETLKLQH